jgi:hypothetical protein
MTKQQLKLLEALIDLKISRMLVETITPDKRTEQLDAALEAIRKQLTEEAL